MNDAPKPRGPIDTESLPWEEWSEGVRYGSRFRALSNSRKDSRRIGVAIEELPPGKQSCPFHYHLVEEEHILALEGQATLRWGDERFALKAGDYVCFPAGERLGHCLVNEGDNPFRFVVIGTREANDACIYPDSGKVMIRNLDGAVFRDGARAEYWDGERTDEPIFKA